MTFDFNTLEPLILTILSAPDIDLETISARRVRHQLPDLNPSLTPQFLKQNKDDVDAVIARVYEKVSAGRAGGSNKAEETVVTSPELRKRTRENKTEDSREYEDDEEKEPPQKKAKKRGKTEISDAELARKLNDEINSRSRRTTTIGRGTGNGTGTRGGRTKKSSAIVESDEDSGDDNGAKKPKKRSTGPAKGGFGKEYALRCFLILYSGRLSLSLLFLIVVSRWQLCSMSLNCRDHRWLSSFGFISRRMNCRTRRTRERFYATSISRPSLEWTRSICFE